MAYKIRLSHRKSGWGLGPVPTFRTPEEHREILSRQASTIIDANRHMTKAALKKARKQERRALLASKKVTAKPVEKKSSPRAVEYYAYLASDEWRQVKVQWMKSRLCKGKLCHAAGCGQTVNLQMHHRTYKRLGNESMSDLVLVCGSCHLKIHDLEKTGVKLREATKRIVGY